MNIIEILQKYGVHHFIYEDNLKNETFLQRAKSDGKNCISVLDTRTAVYYATGLCAQNKTPVAVFTDSASSRSAFPGMTEAFYRRLPVILITLGETVDYSVELKDVVMSHYVLSVNSGGYEWEAAFGGEFPIHIEVRDYHAEVQKCCVVSTELRQVLHEALDETCYLYLGQDVQLDTGDFKCKVVRGGLTNCSDGAVSNVLGASLAGIRNRYIGVFSEREFLHDMNALGNINVNNSLLFLVKTEKESALICDYAQSLGFKVCKMGTAEWNKGAFLSVLGNGRKTMISFT